MLANVLTALVVLGLVGIGVGAMLAPRFSSGQYGIVVDDPRALAFIRAMGVRDLVIGLLVLLLAWTDRRDLLAWGLVVSAAIAVVDFAVVAADRPPPGVSGAPWSSRLAHAGGALGLLFAAWVIAG